MGDILDKRSHGQTPEQKQKQALARRQQLEDLRGVMSTSEGRRFMWRLLGETNLFALSYTGNAETYFREGRRSVGLNLFKDLHEACHKLYQQMEQENSGI